MMRKSWISAAAVGAVMMATPVLAAESADQKASGAGAVSASSAAAAQAGKPTKYCFMTEATTGSRLSRKVCQTEAEWAKAGVNTAEELKRSRR